MRRSPRPETIRAVPIAFPVTRLRKERFGSDVARYNVLPITTPGFPSCSSGEGSEVVAARLEREDQNVPDLLGPHDLGWVQRGTVDDHVGPGLGQDSIDAGKRAALVGGALVIVYMLTTYGVFGIFADLALGVHILLIFASMALLGATLTLPGIAGIVFTIGMAVDSNVLIYERIREEAHLGRSVVSALDAGFRRAFATIVDSNVTMFVAAVILYLFGSGAVRGFAVSLGLGILTSIITAVTMTRMMIALWYRRSRATKLPI